MKNIVNRALVAKKKQFQSKSVPRGTRTIWRYLGALFLLFTFAIGNVMAAETILATFRITLSAAPTDKYASYSDDDATYTCNKVGSSSSSNYALVGSQYYMKLTAKDAYVKIKLKSGSIAAGDKVYVYHNHTTNKSGVGFAMTQEGTNGATDDATANTELKLSYTLTASDIAADGSISVYRQGSNLYVGRIEVAHPEPECTKPGTPADLAVDSKTYNSATFSWSAAANSDGYKVYVEKKSDKSKILDWTTCTTISYTATGLAAETEYTFKVKAIGASGYCELGDEATIDVTTNAAPAVCPSGLTISGTAAYTEGETISLTAALEAGNGGITYTWYKGSIAAGNEVGTGDSFSKANCVAGDAGDYFCVASKDACANAESAAYAVTVAAPSYCAELNPATSGDEPVLGTVIAMQTGSYGGSIKVVGRKQSGSFAYTANGLTFNKGGVDSVRVTLGHLIQAGTIISVTVNNQDGSKDQGFYLQNLSKTKKADMHRKTGSTGDTTYVYTAVAGDGLVGVNEFIIARGSSSAALKSLKVSNCGAELLALSSAVSVAGKATVTLSKSLVAAGGTATASYSDLDSEYEFDGWEITSGDATIADATAATAAITMGTTASTITLKLKAAGVKYAVHFDSKGGSAVADQSIDAGGHAAVPTAPTKFKYTFGGWSETDGGSTPADLSAIAITAEKTFYAIWTPKVCPTSGEIYSLVADPTKAPGSNTYYPTTKPGVADLAIYATVSGGLAQSIQTTSSNNSVQIQSSTAEMKITADNSIVRALLECPLQEGDTIKLVKGNKLKITFDSVATSAKTIQLASGVGENKDYYVVEAKFAGMDTIHVRKDGSNVSLTSLKVIRPAKFAVTFNMHDHGDQVAQQNIIKGGKVSEPATASITGWDFGGWYKTYVADPESYSEAWDFENDVVSDDIELHAKWTAHVASNDVALGTLSVNGEAITIVPSQLVYAVELPFGTTAVPAVTATANDANAKACNVTQALAVDGSATIYVKAEDNTTEATYTINFSVATSKAIQLVFKTGTTPCVGSASTSTQILSNNAAVSTYINQITFTNVEGAGDDGAEGGSLNVGKKAGNMFTLSAKPGYAFQAMNFLAKIQDATCEYSIDGGAWTELASTNTGGDECYAPFTSGTVHEFRLRSTGTSGVWIRNMQLTIVEACTPITLAWDEEPVEFEVGKAGYAIAATANNSGTVAYSSTDDAIIEVVAETGALTINGLGSATLKAATAEGDGTAYCANGGEDIVINKVVNTYYLVSFDAQNGDAADEVKYYSGDAAIALPAAPSYPGYDFQGWFDAETGGNQYTAAITPAASTTVYAQWVAQCAGATITTQPTGASYLTGRTPVALVCEATAGNGGALTYEWFTCDDAVRTNPVAATATPSTAVAGTFYYFCKVTEAGCAVEAFSDVVTITVADKDAICIIKSTPTSGTEADVDGVYQGNAYFNGRASDKKLNSKYNYVAVELADGYTFQAGDKVVLNQTAEIGASDITKFYVFADVPADGKSYVTVLNTSPVQGDNWFEMPAELVGQSSLYIGRVDASCNPTVGYLAVYRACAPILNKVTVNGAEGKPNALKEVVFEVAASTSQSQLEAIAFDWISNNDAWTADPANAPVAANAWEFGVANEVTFTDKDGDQSVYTITVNKAVPSSDATLSALSASAGVLSPTFDPAVLNYTVALPYGTSNVPTLSATKNFVGAADPVIVDAATFTNRQAVSTVTVTAEDGITELTYTVTFHVERFPSIVIWDGSTMSAVAESPDATTGFAWTVTGFSSVTNYSATCGEKAYTKCLPSNGGASASRNIALNVPEGYLAKFYIVFGTHSDGNKRGMFIGSTATKTLDESSVLTLYSSSRTNLTAGMSELVFGAGTWYINPMESVDFYEISATLIPIDYTRDVTEGRYGTICLPNGGIMVGAELFEIAYYGQTSHKIFLDNIPSGEMVAGRPYIFLPKEGTTQLAVFYTDEANASQGNHNGLYGFIGTSADEYFYIPAGEGNYILQNNLYREVLTGGQARILSNRAYIKLGEINPSEPALAPGRRRVAMGVQSEQVATGCENLNVSDKPVKMIINGQLFILRGEKMYDAKGQLVK